MTNQEKTVVLDILEYQLVREGLSELSFQLEEFSNFRADIRFEKISPILKKADLPNNLKIFQEDNLDWQKAKKILF
jgi:hypothetical protein